MGLLKRNPNEVNYVGGKKHWTDIIKNSGEGNLLMWRQPEEDFNTKSTLIVYPSEEAIFYKNGVVEAVFSEGRHILSTQNYPVISRLRNAFSGGVSTFNCVVYFVRKTQSVEILWGTNSPIQVRDPILNIATSVRAHGAYKVQVEDSVKFLTKLVGLNVNMPAFAPQDLEKYFSGEFAQHIKASIARSIQSSGREILGICAEQDTLAGQISPFLSAKLAEYGLKLLTFTIAGISIPEDDPNRQLLENSFARRGARAQDAYAKREEQEILGINWAQRETAEILHGLGSNPGAGGIAAAGAGLGLGMVGVELVGGMAQNVLTPLQGGNADDHNDPVKKIKQLKDMLDLGAITQDEYDQKKKEILARL